MGAELLAQPGIEGEIAVRRRQIRIVVARGGIDVVAARRLDADHHIAERQRGERERAVHDDADRPPASPHRSLILFLNFGRQLVEEFEVIWKRQAAPGSGGLARPRQLRW